jgi:hypothetical protein
VQSVFLRLRQAGDQRPAAVVISSSRCQNLAVQGGWAVRLLQLISALVLLAPGAHAEKRVALVIGNGAYRNVTQLPNPRNDASDIAASLTRLNFSVSIVMDGTFDDMRRALLQFGREAVGATWQ